MTECLVQKRAVLTMLKQRGLAPKERLGQNFLISKSVVAKIISAADIKKEETVLEIGGGLGALSAELAQRAKNLTIVEKDAALCDILRDLLYEYKNVKIICADARKLTEKDLPSGSYKVVANLPYNSATYIIRRLLENKRAPKELMVMVQKEVADRICAKPPRMHLMSVAIQLLAQPKKVFRIPREATWPRPDVESALLFLKTIPDTPHNDYEKIIEIAQLGFKHPRKYVLKNIRHDQKTSEEFFPRCNVPLKARAQEVTINQWKCLAQTIYLR